MLTIGIDPGKKGGIACIMGQLALACPMPLAGKEIHLARVRDIIQDFALMAKGGQVETWIELVGSVTPAGRA
ncbi:MAG: hypothetical protein ACOC9P_02265, partial [bacterium]